MLQDRAGLTLVEYIVGAAIVISLAGTATYALFEKLSLKITAISDGL